MSLLNVLKDLAIENMVNDIASSCSLTKKQLTAINKWIKLCLKTNNIERKELEKYLIVKLIESERYCKKINDVQLQIGGSTLVLYGKK